MQISAFQGLCLLPDGESYLAFRRIVKAGGKSKWRRFAMDIEAVNKLAEQHYTTRLCQKKGIGYVMPFGNIYLKMDRARFKKYLDANDLEIRRGKNRRHSK